MTQNPGRFLLRRKELNATEKKSEYGEERGYAMGKAGLGEPELRGRAVHAVRGRPLKL